LPSTWLPRLTLGTWCSLHFSGYGSQVQLQTDTGQPYLAWVTVDSRLPTEQNPTLGNFLELDVISQLQGLATSNLTTVIDAGYQDRLQPPR
jgi:hypothetical protein